MDIIARCVNAAFHISHDIRRDVEVAAVLLGPENPPKCVRFIGSELKYLNPDERSTGALIRNALLKHSDHVRKLNDNMNKPDQSIENNERILDNEIRASPGIYISDSGFNDILDFYSNCSDLIYLNETANDINELNASLEGTDQTFILSDHKDFSDEEEKMISDISKFKISIGPNILHTDQCIILVHNHLDKMKKSGQ
jgi:tRNA (pseudouridine54-N1)-methyltransferase